MTHKKLTGIAAVTVAGLLAAMTPMTPAFAQSTPATSGDAMNHGAMDKGMMDKHMDKGMAKVSAKDKKFMMEAAMGGMEEVAMGKLAAANATDPDVKAFGQKMVDDHSKANDQLKQLAETKGVTLPADMDKSQHKDMDKLAKMTGMDFDHAYVKMMVKDHKKDVSEFAKESKSANDPDLKGWAGGTLPTLQDHLKMIEGIESKMGGMMDHKMKSGS
jgi:putative membrane protein